MRRTVITLISSASSSSTLLAAHSVQRQQSIDRANSTLQKSL